MTTYTGTLKSGQEFYEGDTLTSPKNTCQLVLKSDGNLVISRLSDHSVIWATNTAGQTPTSAIMQTDGNFVLYDDSDEAIWSSGTGGHPGATLSLGDYGNLVVQIASIDGLIVLWGNESQKASNYPNHAVLLVGH